MKALKKSLLAVAATTLLSIGTSAQAGVIIDLFNDNPSQFAATSTLYATQTSQVAVAGALGGWRDLSITKTADSSGNVNDGESRIASGGGTLSIDNANGNKSLGVVTWDGANDAGAQGGSVNALGLGGVDLTFGGAANALLASIQAVDLGFSYQILVWDIFGNSSILSAAVQFPVDPESLGPIPVPGPVPADYQFAWFNLANNNYSIDGLNFNIAGTGGVDFTKIGALQLKLTNPTQASVDLGIGRIETVPEPDSLALIGAALFGVVAVTRSRKTSARV